jgi:hypothetical protein
MCFGGSPPKPPKPPQEEQKIDAAASDAREAERRRQRGASGVQTYESSLLTGGSGLTAPASTAPKSLLGA